VRLPDVRSLYLMGLFLVASSGCGSPRTAASARAGALEMLPAARALPALTQELMNALPGDSTVWERYLSDRAVYVGEDAAVMSKQELLHGFGPFPPGMSGSIEVKNPRVTEFGDVAVLVFEGDEQETVYDQHIEVKYLSTFTWQREDGRWRLIAAQTLVVPKDPTPTPIDARRLDAYVGTYELSGQRRYRVERRDDALVGGAENGELKPLIAVGENVFVDASSNIETLRIFVIESDGSVKRMLVRRKFADLTWLRIP